MPTGLLEVFATVRPSELWPGGQSDADTLHLTLAPPDRAFRFRASPGEPFRVTRVFEGAVVRGRIRKSVIDPKGRMSLRLEGIDAPELHYRAPSELSPKARSPVQQVLFRTWSGTFRQPLGESASSALRSLLLASTAPSQEALRCRITTRIDDPGEAFDTYGRLVGQIHVDLGGTTVDLNRWLVAEGLAFPAFYESFDPDEQRGLSALAARAREARLGVWRTAAPKAVMDWTCQYRSGRGAPYADSRGSVLWPKLFRRLCGFAVNERAGMVSGSFFDYLRGRRDACVRIAPPDGSEARGELVDWVAPDGRLRVQPDELVFDEAPAVLVTPKGSPRW